MSGKKSIKVEYVGVSYKHPGGEASEEAIHTYRVVEARNTVAPRVGTDLTEDELFELGRSGAPGGEVEYTIVPRKL